MLQRFFVWVKRYEKHLSALAMVAGFVSDNLLFIRVDLVQTQILFGIYAAACVLAIALLHWFEARGVHPRWRLILPFVTQFALGGFWSGFVIFYGRSADLGASWPFLLFLLGILIASEYFHQYHARLVFTCVLFFFALYSCAIFEVPIVTGTLGPWTFFLSTLIAIGLFALFTILLRALGRAKFLQDVWRIRFGAGLVVLLMNIFYFTSVLPPLPLSAEAVGVYHSITRVPGTYYGTSETKQSWQVRYLGFAPTLHIVKGGLAYAYASVFAPTALTTDIVHEWQWYDGSAWVTKGVVRYSITGGRDGGYRGYSKALMSAEGKWRVNIETSDGRLIARLPFTVVYVPTAPAEETITLK